MVGFDQSKIGRVIFVNRTVYGLVRRRMQLVNWVSFGCWSLAWTFAPGVWAREPTIAFNVHTEGSAECTPDAFSAKLAALSPRLRPAGAAEAGVAFTLQIAKMDGVFRGRLRVRELDGNETTRAITGASCDEVLSALALIAVVLIDTSESPRPSEASALAVEAPVTGSGPEDDSAGSWLFGAGVGAGIETAVSAEVVPTVSLELEAAFIGPGAFSPRLAIAVHRSAASTVETAAGSAHFRWTAARISGCPVRFPIAARLALRPCLFFDVGSLEATGQNTYQGSSANVTWYALGGFARAEYVPFAPLSLGVDGGLLLPLVHDRYYFDPGGPSNTLQLPRLGLTLRAGLAVYFE